MHKLCLHLKHHAQIFRQEKISVFSELTLRESGNQELFVRATLNYLYVARKFRQLADTQTSQRQYADLKHVSKIVPHLWSSTERNAGLSLEKGNVLNSQNH